MKLKFKDQELTLYDTINDCRTDSNKKGYGCVKRGNNTYYFDLVPTTDPFATKLRYKKKSNGTTYTIADSNLKDLSRWGRNNKDKFNTNDYSTGTTLTQEGINYLKYARGVNMARMFYNCANLTTLDVSNWDTSRVTDMTRVFDDCNNLQSLNVSNWNTSKVTNMEGMFSGCGSLSGTLNLSNWDTSNVTDTSSMFRDTGNVTINAPSLNLSKNTTMWYMFMGSDIENLNVPNWNIKNVTDMDSLFYSAVHVTSIDASNWDTSNVTNMYRVFSDCTSLTSLKVSNWNTSKVTNLVHSFYRCASLETLNIVNWDVSNVTSMYYMFTECSSLTSLDLSKWNTSKVTNMGNIFENNNSLIALDLSNWDTSGVTLNQMQYMFKCRNLQYLILGSTTFKFIMHRSDCGQLNTTCKILVPRALLNTFKTATNWSSRASQFDAIENYNITRSNGKVTVTHK